jgi:hypothetical protein
MLAAGPAFLTPYSDQRVGATNDRTKDAGWGIDRGRSSCRAARIRANVLTVVLLLGAADGTYEAARRISGMRLRVSGADAAIGAIALRDAALGIAGPSTRQLPGGGTLLALAILGGLAAPSLRRTAHRMRAAEQRLRGDEERVRRERIRRYAAARDRVRASAT